MIARDNISKVTWPADQLSAALCAVARRAGLPAEGISRVAAWPPPGDDPAEVDGWLAAAAEAIGAETEAVTSLYPARRAALLSAGPALIALNVDGESQYLAVVGRHRGRVAVVTPAGKIARLRPHAVLDRLASDPLTNIESTLERVLTNVPRRRQRRTRVALCNELLGATLIPLGWILRVGPKSPPWVVAQQFGLLRLLARLIAAYVLAATLWIVSWWLLGSTIFSGQLNDGWLWAWVLALASQVPVRVWTNYAAAQLALRGAVALKQRLMAAAVQTPSESTSGQGVGGLMGRIAETETLDSLATLGGFLTLTAAVELIAATTVLMFGAAPLTHLAVIAVVSVLAGVLVVRYAKRYEHWTNQRLALTGDLVEKMLGQRTRIIQQPVDDWHRGEDQLLEQNLALSGRMDIDAARLQILVPRSWFMLGLVGLAAPLLFGEPALPAVAISLGALLMATESWARLCEGLLRLSAARAVWTRVRPLLADGQADSRLPRPPRSLASAESGTLLEARGLSYRYPGRPQQVLEHVDLRIAHGGRILLQGDSGGGKSTLAQLLAGGRSSQSGVLLLCGLDAKALGTETWRHQVVLAPQFHENHLIMGPLALNLLMGRRWPPDAKDLQAAEETCQGLGLGPLLDRMPGGLFQIVGETGWQLSHGERSRVYLARALLQGGRLLILDESFAALDPVTQKTVFEYVNKTAPAMLVIAHP